MYKAGTATRIITPTEPMWLAGFAVRAAPSQGKLDDLYVKAVAIEDAAGKRLVIVSADLIAIPRNVSQRVAAEAMTRFGLNRDELLLCATHTHYAPELRPDKVPFFHIPPEYAAKIQPFADQVVASILKVIEWAVSEMIPAKLSRARASASFATNRRMGEDPIDHDVPILQITAKVSGKPIATLFGYACHNTTMPPEDRLISGDWAGFACETISKKLHGSPAVFIAGAGADQNPYPKSSVEISRQHGKALADAVLSGLSQATPIDGKIATAFEEVPLDYQPLPSRELLEADIQSDDQPRRTKAEFLLHEIDQGKTFDKSYPCPIQTIRIGESFTLIAIGGEPVIDYAVNLKREFANDKSLVWLAGYANDMFGYVPTIRVLRGGGYEGTRSVLWSALPMPFTESTEERVLSGIRCLLNRR